MRRKTIFMIIIMLTTFFATFVLCSCSSMSFEQRKERSKIKENASLYYEEKYGEKMGRIKKELSVSFDEDLYTNTKYNEGVAFEINNGYVIWDGYRFTDTIQSDKITKDIKSNFIDTARNKILEQKEIKEVIFIDKTVITACAFEEYMAFKDYYNGNIIDYVKSDKITIDLGEVHILLNSDCDYQTVVDNVLEELKEYFSIDIEIYVYDIDAYNKYYRNGIDNISHIQKGTVAKYATVSSQNIWYTYETIEAIDGVFFISDKAEVELTESDVIIEKINLDKNYHEIIERADIELLSPCIYKITVSDKIKNETGGCLSILVNKDVWKDGFFYEIENGSNLVFCRSSLENNVDFSDISFGADAGFYCFIGKKKTF